MVYVDHGMAAARDWSDIETLLVRADRGDFQVQHTDSVKRKEAVSVDMLKQLVDLICYLVVVFGVTGSVYLDPYFGKPSTQNMSVHALNKVFEFVLFSKASLHHDPKLVID
jgi:hypothetical protein